MYNSKVMPPEYSVLFERQSYSCERSGDSNCDLDKSDILGSDSSEARNNLRKIDWETVRWIIWIAQKEHPETWADVMNEMK